jgi:hypothetical protein
MARLIQLDTQLSAPHFAERCKYPALALDAEVQRRHIDLWIKLEAHLKPIVVALAPRYGRCLCRNRWAPPHPTGFAALAEGHASEPSGVGESALTARR